MNKFLKKISGVVMSVICSGLLLSGCVGQIQPTTMTATAIKPTATYEPIETPWGLAPYAPVPTLTLIPLPKDVFDNFEELSGHCKIKISFGVITSGAMVEEPIISDLTVGQIWFSLFWREGDLDLILIKPDGTLLDTAAIEADRTNKSFTSEHGLEQYFTRAPQLGTWKARIFGKSTPPKGTPYVLEISAQDSTHVSIQFDKTEYFSGNPVKITAKLPDTDIYWEYNRDVVIKVIAENPAKQHYSFDLHDDGLHGDEMGGDGIFANKFDNTLVEGVYKFYFKLSGHNQRVYYENDDPQSPTHAPFERECFVSTEVKE